MLKIYLSLLALNFCLFSTAQMVISLQPGPTDGIDAVLNGHSPNTNFGNDGQFISYDWTFSGTRYQGYSLMKFDLSTLPGGIGIADARLFLYYNPTSGSAGQSDTNACYLKKITSSWDEMLVTYNIIPTATSTDQVLLPTSTSATQDYPNIDITTFVADWYANPNTNFGMLLELENLALYRSMKFASSDYPDSTLRPKLVISFEKVLGFAEEAEASFQISPNPSAGQFKIKAVGKRKNKPFNFKIFDPSGRLVQFGSRAYDSEVQELTNFAPGVYFVQVHFSNVIETKKLIVR